ncbi:hypothetical protein MYP_1015 [Sporocytophaga myxococcoides]|uniref:Glycosyltransferase 61 catalytic domain-containing protein n=1 Tax=Sporocytophaga myxococcoides TaxID=153721 RepID=A0A098LBK6_9BACT|nr:glycosyltransferase family 61 protein [Sporocytophaga myxococcoides]GAL83787.1 hypothetical protein MYP_1015 [Sporocytophaga myxococcoides]
MSFVKRILKKLFPIVFLKECFLWYNKIKLRTLDALFYPHYKISEDSFLRDFYLIPVQEYKISLIKELSSSVTPYFKFWELWKDHEYIVHLQKPCVIEPATGWAFVEGNKLVSESLGLGHAPHVRKPGLFSFFIKKRRTTKFSKIVSLRDTGEDNYFHFYNDVIGKIFFLKNEGIDLNDYTFIVHEKLWEKNYFQSIYNSSTFLKSLKWHVQKDDFVEANESIFCKPLTHKPEIFQEISSQVLREFSQAGRRIYLKRSRSRLRFVENEEEIENVLINLGFQVVDAALLNLEEQVRLFSSVRFLVAIHGAGLTNIFFRQGQPLSMLEIFPYPENGCLPFHYIMLAQQNKFRYNAMIGERSSRNFSGGFNVNPVKLKEEVIRILEYDET